MAIRTLTEQEISVVSGGASNGAVSKIIHGVTGTLDKILTLGINVFDKIFARLVS